MLKRLIISSIDHALFTVSFIAGVQLPAFIQQYTQLVNGKLSEAKYHLNKFQDVAQLHFEGNLENLKDRYLMNADPAIKQTGVMVEELIIRVKSLEEQLLQLTQQDYIQRVYYFLTHFEAESVQSTAKHFQLSIPLTIESLATGLVISTLLIFTRAGVSTLFTFKRSAKHTY